ncbi:hypothetical protein BCR43DRAFT_482217 [Syncephalastrum racemosum]|uniref:Uncharacterized protein n=1 Tax=Syncephalastrum racemosum TaxID=13706 RepID=A0A1X2HT93_SYNRA|nr:hypothetical protein BCR43DRAFT_482217 [Syncephalastrum racemosum]
MSRADAHYICSSAANAIISEIGPYRVSSDALQTINQFLDEFLVFLLSSSLSLDLSRIKAVVFTLLPSTLGKNAIVEAELEVKTFTETEAIDYESYERMRTLGNGGPFPVHDALPLLREKCLEFCTLADKDDNVSLMHQASPAIQISPIVAIYVTTIIEHIAEYVLTAIAMTAEHEDTEFIRMKEVFLALMDDVQVGGVFYRMELREKLEKRGFAAGYRTRATPSYLSTASATPQKHVRSSTNESSTDSSSSGLLDISFDDLDIGYDDDASRPPTAMSQRNDLSLSLYSVKSSARPNSFLSGSTSNATLSTAASSNNSKKAFKLFKKDEYGPSVSVYDPDVPAMNFEDLIRSGNTMRVSLTPNRLRSIEVKDQRADTMPEPGTAWERRSTSAPSRKPSKVPLSRATSPAPPVTSPLAASGSLPTSVATATPPKKEEPDLGDALKEYEERQKSLLNLHKPLQQQQQQQQQRQQHQQQTTPKGKPASLKQPQEQQQPIPREKKEKSVTASPTAPADGSKTKEALTPFENPREAPKPSVKPTSVPKTAENAPMAAPIKIMDKKSASSSEAPVHAITTDAKVASVPAKPAAIPATPNKSELPKAGETKVLRRGSMSKRKSRENLRRRKSMDEDKRPLTPDQPSMPKHAQQQPQQTTQKQQQQSKQQASPAVSAKSSIESVRQQAAPLPSPPASESTSSSQHTSEDEKQMDLKIIPEDRPSSIVAKRVTTASRRHSLHESYAAERQQQMNASTAGSVERSIKVWAEIMKGDEDQLITPAAARRRSMMREQRHSVAVDEDTKLDVQHPPQEERARKVESRVLDKVLKFEQNSIEDFAQQHHRQHRASAYIPRRERFLYLQREPGVLERRTATATAFPKRTVGVDAQTQTDFSEQKSVPQAPALIVTSEDAAGVTTRREIDVESERSSECGLVDGDEEWFLQDDDWEDVGEQETAVVEWLLGEA